MTTIREWLSHLRNKTKQSVEKTKAETPFEGTIAHGFFVLSFAVKFSLDVFPKQENNSYNLNH